MAIKDLNALETGYTNTWCPGCPNFVIRSSLKKAIFEHSQENNTKEGEYVLVTDIGCSSKIYDYIKVSGLNSLHGRAITAAHGVKMGNPNLHVIADLGDGGAYAEGLSHFLHACRNNTDITVLIHDNQVFALTTGQSTPTTPKGYKEKVHPSGIPEEPMNPLALAMVSGATFIARANSLDLNHTAEMIKKAMDHKGISIVEITQPCISFFDTRDKVRERVYHIENHDVTNFHAAIELIGQHIFGARIPVGLIYNVPRPTYEDLRPMFKKLMDEKKSWADISKERSVLKDFF